MNIGLASYRCKNKNMEFNISQIERAMREAQGKDFMIALCGDLWDYPERFRTEHTLLWPVYVNYSTEEWEEGALDEYAAQALLAAKETLLINPLDNDPVSHGGSFCFRNGAVAAQLPFDTEGVLIVTVE